jgi:hypothetical protein
MWFRLCFSADAQTVYFPLVDTTALFVLSRRIQRHLGFVAN